MGSLASIVTHRGEHGSTALGRTVARASRHPTLCSALPPRILQKAVERAQVRLRDPFADSRVGPSERARAQGLLRDVLDAAGRYQEAFVAYSACNESLRHLHQNFTRGERLVCPLSRGSAAGGGAAVAVVAAAAFYP
jgi:hypothetical protein